MTEWVAGKTPMVVELRAFARGLRPDEATVRTGIELPWSNGPAEGQEITLLRAGVDIPLRLTDAVVNEAGDLELSGELTVSLLG